VGASTSRQEDIMVKRFIAAGALFVVMAGTALAQYEVSVTRIDVVYGDTRLTLSNGVRCTDNSGGVRVGPVTDFYSGWFAYYFYQGGVEHSCS
jgi:hypothetical protein